MKDPINDVFIPDLPDEQSGEQQHNVTSISDARLRANRQNAKLSTGPRSDAGREAVSGNSVRHGLSGGKFRLLASESQAHFDELHQHLCSSYAPADPGESELVLSMAQALWMTRRAASGQDRCLEALDAGDSDAAKNARLELPLYLRYQTTHERAYGRHSAELRKLQSDRRKTELGFVSQKAKEAEQQRKQEMHEARIAAVKARTDHQLMKNRFLQYEIALRDKCELKNRQREEWLERSDKERREREAAEAERRAAKKGKE